VISCSQQNKIMTFFCDVVQILSASLTSFMASSLLNGPLDCNSYNKTMFKYSTQQLQNWKFLHDSDI
jgi:hypothetical protein